MDYLYFLEERFFLKGKMPLNLGLIHLKEQMSFLSINQSIVMILMITIFIQISNL